MKVAKFKVSIAIVLIVCSSFASFIRLGNASGYKKDRDVIHVPARTIPVGRTIYGLSTPTKQYFKFVVREEKTIAVQMWPTIDADYDLYLTWTPNVIPQAISAGDPVDNCVTCDGNPEGEPEGDSRTNLSPGTYYIMVHNYSGSGTYDLSVFGYPVRETNHSGVWFNDTRRGTALYILGWSFTFVTPDKTYSIRPPLPLGSHQPIALLRDDRIVWYYENSELEMWARFVNTRRDTRPRTLCVAHLNDKSTGKKYLLMASEPDINIIRIRINSTLQDLSTPTKQYFKYVVRQWMYVSVRMWPSPDADYDLYVKWEPDTIPQAIAAGDPIDDDDCGVDKPGAGVREGCGELLRPGTYYIMVHNYSGTGTYDLSVIGVPVNIIRMRLNSVIRGLSAPTEQWFKFKLPTTMSVRIAMTPTPLSDYRLYVAWVPNVWPEGLWTCGGGGGMGVMEQCAATAQPGTYYFKVAYIEENSEEYGTFDIRLEACTWGTHVFEDQKRETKLGINAFGYFQFEAPSKTFSVKEGGVFIVPKAIPDTVIIRYEDSEIRIWAITRVRGEKDFCIAFAKDIETGITYLLVDRWR